MSQIKIREDRSIKETDFRLDLAQKEKKELHRELVKKYVMMRRGWPESKLSFSDYHYRNIDDILEFCDDYNKKRFNFEYKTDYIGQNTGNMVLEIIGCVDSNSFPDIKSRRIWVGHIERNKMIDFIDKVRRNEIANAKMSRHFIDEVPYYMSYLIPNKNCDSVSSKNDVFQYFIFKGSVISQFLRDNYDKNDIIVTKTKDEDRCWFTISSVFKIELLKEKSEI